METLTFPIVVKLKTVVHQNQVKQNQVKLLPWTDGKVPHSSRNLPHKNVKLKTATCATPEKRQKLIDLKETI